MEEIATWAAPIATTLAALMTASNLGSRITGWGFVVFTVGSIGWITLGLTTNQPNIVWQNVILTLLNLFGIWRWLGRQAKVEEGARAASEASEQTPGEALFPISLLTSASVVNGRTELGRCIDAMAGCRTGRLSYVVVSQGGVAGVGETLRRLPWSASFVEGDQVITEADPDRLEALPRDQWPAR